MPRRKEKEKTRKREGKGKKNREKNSPYCNVRHRIVLRVTAWTTYNARRALAWAALLGCCSAIAFKPAGGWHCAPARRQARSCRCSALVPSPPLPEFFSATTGARSRPRR